MTFRFCSSRCFISPSSWSLFSCSSTCLLASSQSDWHDTRKISPANNKSCNAYLSLFKFLLRLSNLPLLLCLYLKLLRQLLGAQVNIRPNHPCTPQLTCSFSATYAHASSFLSASTLCCCSRAFWASLSRTFASSSASCRSLMALDLWTRIFAACVVFWRHIEYSSLSWLSCVPRKKNYISESNSWDSMSQG